MDFKKELQTIASLSRCKDKKVAALAVLDGVPVAGAWNIKDPNCMLDCNHNCHPMHAEHALQAPVGSTVYLTVYPCEICQEYLYNRGVSKIVVYGKQHKKDLGLIPIECMDE